MFSTLFLPGRGVMAARSQVVNKGKGRASNSDIFPGVEGVVGKREGGKLSEKVETEPPWRMGLSKQRGWNEIPGDRRQVACRWFWKEGLVEGVWVEGFGGEGEWGQRVGGGEPCEGTLSLSFSQLWSMDTFFSGQGPDGTTSWCPCQAHEGSFGCLKRR